MCTSPAGWTISQTSAIIETLADETGLAPAGVADRAKARQLMNDGSDFSGETGSKEDDRLQKWLDYLETQLKGDFFLGSTVSYADF